MGSWNWLDFFIFLIFFLNIILGASRGAAKEITSMMCLSVGLIFAIKFTVPITNFLNTSPLIQDVLSSAMIANFMREIGAGPLTADMLRELSYCISLLISFTGVFFAGEAILNVVSFSQVISFPYAAITRKVGASLGAVRGYVLALFLIIVIGHLFKAYPIKDSFFINLLQGSAHKLDELVAGQRVEEFSDVYKGKNLYNEKDVYRTISQ